MSPNELGAAWTRLGLDNLALAACVFDDPDIGELDFRVLTPNGEPADHRVLILLISGLIAELHDALDGLEDSGEASRLRKYLHRLLDGQSLLDNQETNQ